MQKKLDELTIGDEATIVNVLGEGRVRRRLFDMGVTQVLMCYLEKKLLLVIQLRLQLEDTN